MLAFLSKSSGTDDGLVTENHHFSYFYCYSEPFLYCRKVCERALETFTPMQKSMQKQAMESQAQLDYNLYP